MWQCAVWRSFPFSISPEHGKKLCEQSFIFVMYPVFFLWSFKIFFIVYLSHRSDVAVPVVIFIDVMFQLDVLRSVGSVRVCKAEKSELLAGAAEYV